MESLPKVCPSCRVEYVQSALRCADCDVALEAWSPEAAAAPVSRAGPALPPASELVCLRTGTPVELESLADTLAAQGISSRIAGHPPEGALHNPRRGSFGMGASMGVYVREQDARAAVPIVQEFLAASLGEALEVPAVGEELDACPACGTPLEADAVRCAECGLEFGGEPEA